MDKKKIAECMNVLGNFCGKRDISELTTDCLLETYGIQQADVVVLFGGSILAGGDVMAEVMKNNMGKKYIIVGGAGHTTQTFRNTVHECYPDINTDSLTEAELYAIYLDREYGLVPDYLECESTNCGNNITYLIKLLEKNHVECERILMIQDATMQHRMEASLRRYSPKELTIINYAAYHAVVEVTDNELQYKDQIKGMWDMNRYLELLMGEIPRLSDKEGGYGPRGLNYISHVEIPENVEKAFQTLLQEYPDSVRIANQAYAGI